MAANLLARTRGTLFIAARRRAERRVPFMPRERFLALRDANVRRIVRHAAETVPYYRELFRHEGLDPREIHTADDPAFLPLLAKEPVRREGERFRSTALPAQDGLVLRTTGTTGERLAVFHDRASLLRTTAQSERDWAVVVELCGRSARYRTAFVGYRQANVVDIQRWASANTFRPRRPEWRLISLDLPVAGIVAEVERLRPDVLVASGTYLEALFRKLAADGARLRAPKVLVSIWDAMSDEAARWIEERLGAPVVSRYGAIECLKIGFTCEAQRGFHLHEDLCHVTLVDARGRPVPEGEQGEVVISNLVNRGTVLLNYRLGDVARLKPAGCPCGRTGRLLAGLEGRVDEIIELPGGRLVHPGSVAVAVRDVDCVLQYQLVERRPRSFELRVATSSREAFGRSVGGISARVRELLEGCEVEVVHREEIRSEPGKKLVHVKLLGR